MGWGEMTLAEREHGTIEKLPASRDREHEGALFKKAVVLDMGEASREEGFRLNGCR